MGVDRGIVSEEQERQIRIAQGLDPDPSAAQPAPGGSSTTPVAPKQPVWQQNFNAGLQQGQNLFSNNPEMQRIKAMQEDLAKGYGGEALGAMREQARGEIAGTRQNYLQSMAGKAAKGGIGGARAAAMQGQADVGLQGKNAEMQRSMAMDQSKMVTSGTQNLSDFLMKQRFGEMATGAGYAQMGIGEAQANKPVSGGGGGGLCCFILLEARYGNGTMDSVVRKFRDEKLTPRNQRGYYKLAEVLVPMMRASCLVKLAVRLFMADPMVAYGKAYYGGSKAGFIFKPVVKAWLKFFDYLGGDHKFIRENGEVV